METDHSPDRQSLFRLKAFRHYWIARVSSSGAYQMQNVATAWSVYEITGSALDLGLVGLAQFVPKVLLTLWAGSVADRLDRRRIATACTFIQLATCAVLACGSGLGWLSRELIFGLIAIIGAARAFEMPTMQSILPNIVEPSMFSRALTMSTAAIQIAIIGGPALAGLVFLTNVTNVYIVATALFAVACAMMSLMPPLPARTTSKSSDSLWAGLQFIFAKPVILGAVSLDLFAVLFGGATAMLPIFAKDILHAGPTGLGILQASPAIGALGMTWYLSRFPLKRSVGRSLFISVAIFGVGTILFAISTSFAFSLLMLVMLGAADCVSVVIRQSLVQLETPDDMRGRVSAVNSVFIGASNQLGEFESGVAAALIGIVPSVVAGGVGTLLIVAAWLRLFPTLAARDRLSE
jgi:MFS family permease